MRSRAVRLTLLLLFVIAAGVTAYLFLMGESRARLELDAARAYEGRAIDTVREVAALQSAQQAYVAAGQGEAFWVQKVASALPRIQESIARLRADATALEAQSAMDEAASAVKDFEQMDRRAAEYARSGQKLLASDIIFGDGAELTAAATTSVDAARAAEIGARQQSLAAIRNRQLFAIGAVVAAALLVVLLLVPQPRAADVPATALPRIVEAPAEPADGLDLAVVSRDVDVEAEDEWSPARREPVDVAPAAPVAVPAAAVSAPPAAPARPAVDLTSVASLCTDLARLVDTRSLPSMLERAATALDANGIVLWIADPDGRELSPIVTHGYAPQIVTRLGTILRDGQNATAAAFRTSLVQTVKTDSVSNGAIAAPLVTPGGCVGVMAAEVRNEGEQDATKLAAATIVAAQLATLVGPPASRAKAEAAG